MYEPSPDEFKLGETARHFPATQSGQPSETLWPDPDRSVIVVRQVPSVPPLRCFRGWEEWINIAAQSRSVPPDYVLLPLVTVVGAVLANVRHASPWAGWAEPPVIWGCIVGDPAAGKTPALDAVLGPTRRLEDELAIGDPDRQAEWERDSEAASEARDIWKGEVKAAVKEGLPPPNMPENAHVPDRPTLPRLAVADATVEALVQRLSENPRGLLCVRDEISGLIKGFDRYNGGGDKSFWLEAHEGRRYVVDRVKNGAQPVIVPRTSVAILGGTQPDVALDIFTRGDDDGFAARCWFVWPEAVPPKRPEFHEDSSQLLNALRRFRGLPLQQDQDGRGCPFVVPLAESAVEIFEEFRSDNFHAVGAASGMMKSFLGKTPGKVLRLALVLEYLEWVLSPEGTPEPAEISKFSLAASAALVGEYFSPMAERMFGDAGLPKADRAAAILAGAILRRRCTTLNLRTVRREWGLPGLRDASDAKEAANILLEAGWLCPAPSREGGTAGQQRANFLVNPKLHEASHG
jgi:hypothetical protein